MLRALYVVVSNASAPLPGIAACLVLSWVMPAQRGSGLGDDRDS